MSVIQLAVDIEPVLRPFSAATDHCVRVCVRVIEWRAMYQRPIVRWWKPLNDECCDFGRWGAIICVMHALAANVSVLVYSFYSPTGTLWRYCVVLDCGVVWTDFCALPRIVTVTVGKAVKCENYERFTGFSDCFIDRSYSALGQET